MNMNWGITHKKPTNLWMDMDGFHLSLRLPTFSPPPGRAMAHRMVGLVLSGSSTQKTLSWALMKRSNCRILKASSAPGHQWSNECPWDGPGCSRGYNPDTSRSSSKSTNSIITHDGIIICPAVMKTSPNRNEPYQQVQLTSRPRKTWDRNNWQWADTMCQQDPTGIFGPQNWSVSRTMLPSSRTCFIHVWNGVFDKPCKRHVQVWSFQPILSVIDRGVCPPSTSLPWITQPKMKHAVIALSR